MISVNRAIELQKILEEKQEHKVFVPSHELEQHKKDVEAITGLQVFYEPILDEGEDVFLMKVVL